MAYLNKVMLIGRLTRDPELRYTQSGTAVAEFGLAVNRNYTTASGEKREETMFVDVILWRRRAEVASEYLHKGKPVFVEGRLELDTWESKDGQKRSKLRVVADTFQFLDSGPGRSQQGEGPRSGSSPRAPGGEPSDAPDDLPPRSSDLPF